MGADELIASAFHNIVVTSTSTAIERRLAEQQARLPVRMGGLGLTEQDAIRPAAWIGTWALVWRTMRQLHAPFAELSIATHGSDGHAGSGGERSLFGELRHAHAKLVGEQARVQREYDRFDTLTYDYDKRGNSHTRFHPTGLPPAHTLLPIDAFGSDSKYLETAQRRYSQIIHHASWLRMLEELGRVGLREAVRFISVSQPYAGAFLNAIPMRKPFRIPTWALRIVVQRRLGLALSQALGTHVLDSYGRQHDVHGDAAQNTGHAGHAERHAGLVHALAALAKSMWGSCVHVEPPDHAPYSADYRPDFVALGRGHNGKPLIGEVKLTDPLSSVVAEILQRGRAVAFGNTLPVLQEKVYGLEQRGEEGDGNFKPLTGAGYVAPQKADYEHALSLDCEVLLLAFETFGGFSPDVVRYLKTLSYEVRNKLNHQQYDLTTWSARSWLSFQTQQLSVKLHISCAWEIATELGFAAAVAVADPRGP